MILRNPARLMSLAAALFVLSAAMPVFAQALATSTSTSTSTSAGERAPGVPDPAPVHPELAGVFEQFGGMPGMTTLMDDFMVVLLEDPRMRPFFENVDHGRVKRQLAEQFCAILAGGCAYSGRDMVNTHAGFAVDKADFNALVEDLQIAMAGRGIPFRAQNKLLSVLAPMHREVMTR